MLLREGRLRRLGFYQLWVKERERVSEREREYIGGIIKVATV